MSELTKFIILISVIIALSLVLLLGQHFSFNIIGPVRRYRLLTTPPCSRCSHCIERTLNFHIKQYYCTEPNYIWRREQLSMKKIEQVHITEIRGTKYCRYSRIPFTYNPEEKTVNKDWPKEDVGENNEQ